MATTFSQSPYFDDYDQNKNFYKILYRPGYAIQTRELNQVQSMLQAQVERVGSHLFQDGAMVIPGFISYDTDVVAVKLQTTNPSLDKVSLLLPSLVETVVTGQVSGAKALVVHYEAESTTEPNTIYVRYIQSGTSSVGFIDGETISNDALVPVNVIAQSVGCIAAGSLATLQQGIYYIKGYFVLVSKEIITLDKYATSPSYRVGLSVSEEIITPDDDETLNDNAIGAYSFTAPGAHRYKISARLVKLSLTDTNDGNFVELLRINNGVVENKVVATDYSVLEDTLARRTYDESGDYTVLPFKSQLREHRSNARGVRQNSTAYIQGDIIEYTTGGTTYTYNCVSGGTSGTGAPTYVFTFGTFSDGSVTWEYTETPVYNLGVHLATDTEAGDESKFVVSLEGGKAYVRGYELNKMGTSYVNVDKPRDFDRANNATLTVTTGNYVRVSTVNTVGMFSVPETLGANFPTVDLYDEYSATGGTAAGAKVGTAVVTAIEKDDSIANTWKVFLINIQMNAGKTFDRNVKSLYYNNTTMSIDFTGSLLPVATKLTGSASCSTSTVTGVGTLFSTELVVGDWVSFDLSTWYKVASGITNTGFTITGTASATGVAIYRASATIYEPNSFAGLIPFSNSFIRKVRSADDTTSDTVYTITRNFGTLSASAGVITITLSTSGETFASVANATNYITILNSSGVHQAPSYSVNGPSTVLTISGLSGTNAYTVIGTITKSAAQRSKTLTIASPIDLTTSSTAQAAQISLGKADCYKLLSVKMAPAFGAITGGNLATIDITNNYEFDDGQRTTHYDRGSIKLKSGYFPPTGSIRIVFEYFTHGAGDYFSVESYTNIIPYTAIDYHVRDGLDFRPSMNDAGTAFDGSNTGVLKRGYNITADYSYYLSRIDTLSIDSLGNFFITKGVSGLSPVIPQNNKQAMLISILYMQPYGIDSTSHSVRVELIDNKRYTMRDIGALEKRIGTLEYYTSLSMLEQETKALSIPDANGLERYKNGFLVDGFSDHGIGATSSLDYRCSIDGDNKELRPMHFARNADLVEKNVNTAQRTSDGYVITGDLITLPYTHQKFISQEAGSRIKNVNPFAVFTFIGNTIFTPSSDDWFDTTYAPDIQINREGNFQMTKQALTSAGVLGTKWNSWQTTWTGVKKTNPHLIEFTSEQVEGKDWPFRRANVETTNITTTVQHRTGVTTNVVESIDTHEISDKVISTSIIPYMRQRNILVFSTGLKPNTIFHPFFDNVDVSAYVTTATTVVVTPVVGYPTTFNYTTNVGGSITDAARLYDGVADSAFSTGDIVTGSITGATGIVALQENASTGTIKLYLINVKGSFVSGEILVGNISGSRGLSGTISVGAAGNTLLSNMNGTIIAVFRVPNSDKLKFRTGTREFILTTQANNDTAYTSISRGQFSSAGLLNTKQKTIESVRNAKVVTTQVSANRTVVTKGQATSNEWYDPLAQTFLVKQEGGAFLTKVDIFFGSKDDNIPVNLEIREVENGYPSKFILPLSQVSLTPDKVLLSTTIVTAPDGKDYAKDDVATSFVFPSPVYVKNNTEYCVVLLSDSNNYNVWISHLGDKQIGADRYISEQPYAGVLFESQNASTWTANQLEDLKFVIHRAKFTTNTYGTVNFVNYPLGTDVLAYNSLQTVNGSNVVRVYHYNHGMIATDSVTLSGIAAGTYNGIPAAELTGTKTIANVDMDSYTITTTTNANATGFTGGSGLNVTFNVKYDSIEPSFQILEFPDASMTYTFKPTSTASALSATFLPLTINDTTDFSNSSIIASQINETNKMSGVKSLQIAASMITTNDSVSPVIDTHRASVLCVTNRISNTTNALNVNPLDFRLLTPAATSTVIGVDGTNEYFTTSDASTKAVFLTAVVGKYLTTTGFANGANNGTFLITAIASDGAYIKVSADLTTEAAGATVTAKIGDYFVHEITPVNGSAAAKYVTKVVQLANLSKSIKVMFAYNKPVEAEIDVYYRTGSVSAIDVLNAAPYTLMTNSGLVSTDSNTFTDTEYNVDNIAAFTAIQVKVVMRSTNTAKIPSIKDLRVIVLA